MTEGGSETSAAFATFGSFTQSERGPRQWLAAVLSSSAIYVGLVVAAVVLYVTTPEAKQWRAFFSGLKYLTLPFIALFLIAVSNHAQFYGYTVWHFDLPQWLSRPAAVLRGTDLRRDGIEVERHQ